MMRAISWHNECSEWIQQFDLELLEKGGPLSSLDFSTRFPKSKPWTSFYKTSARKLTTNQLFLQNARELYRKWADNLKNCTMINKKLPRFTSNINTRLQRMSPILHWKHCNISLHECHGTHKQRKFKCLSWTIFTTNKTRDNASFRFAVDLLIKKRQPTIRAKGEINSYH